jgi:hypothetical protein
MDKITKITDKYLKYILNGGELTRFAVDVFPDIEIGQSILINNWGFSGGFIRL